MKWRSLFFLLTCFLMQNLIFGEDIKGKLILKKRSDDFDLTCSRGNWWPDKGQLLTLSFKDTFSEYKCLDVNNNTLQTLTVKIRTCENCIELDNHSLSAIIVGNILATFFIAFAVYSITGQSKGKSFSGNKASDKVNLLSSGNGESDTYQPLNPGQSSEYSRLGGLRKN